MRRREEKFFSFFAEVQSAKLSSREPSRSLPPTVTQK